jgi:2-hydroxychromene-2-carboxylate isomerase
MRVRFVLDYRSPYAYLANTQLDRLATPVEYEPIDILWVMQQVNNQPSPMCPPKAKYARLDAMRWAQKYGVAFSPNRSLLEAMRLGEFRNDLLSCAGIAAQTLQVFEQANNALFEAVWSGSSDLTSAEGRLQFLSSRNLPRDLWDVAESAEIREMLALNSRRAVEDGVFGVPTFFVDDEIFFGNDRLEQVDAKLKSSSVEAQQ